MKSKLTVSVWAGALLALAVMSVPAAGQEKPVMKTGVTVENVSNRDVQLRADDEWTPDSAIVYSPGGEKQTKYVYLPGESYGEYTWENGVWKFSEAAANTWLFSGSSSWKFYSEQLVKISHRIYDDILQFFFPYTGPSHGYYSFPASTDFKPEFDTDGNLTSFKVGYDADAGIWDIEFFATYNAKNNPVSIEGWDSFGDRRSRRQFFKAHYEYDDYGYASLFESYEWDWDGEETWTSDVKVKETAEYDALGKILSREYYKKGAKRKSRESFEYYDENHFSSISYTDYENENNSYRYEWKYGTDGNPGAYYDYSGSELQYYAIFYPNALSPSVVEPVPESAATRVWSSGGQLYITAASTGTAQVYTLTGQPAATVALTTGETAATPLPPGVYIVAAEGRTWKAVIR
jgi:hypothetical protein